MLPRRGARGRLAAACAPAGHLETKESIVTNRTYRVTEIVGSSTESVDAAIRNGIQRAAQTLRHVDWFEVTQIRGHLTEDDVDHIQVGMKIGFRLEDPE
jgi:flavin-binding protein dodecin